LLLLLWLLVLLLWLLVLLLSTTVSPGAALHHP
jgi:hypothetical protein